MPSSRWMLAIVRLPHISNFTDFMPLEQHPLLGVRYVQTTRELGAPDLRDPARHEKHRGRPALAAPVRAGSSHAASWPRRGTPVLGVCGGYQMLGQTLADPDRHRERPPADPARPGPAAHPDDLCRRKAPHPKSGDRDAARALCRGAADRVRDPHRAHHRAGRTASAPWRTARPRAACRARCLAPTCTACLTAAS